MGTPVASIRASRPPSEETRRSASSSSQRRSLATGQWKRSYRPHVLLLKGFLKDQSHCDCQRE